MLFKSNQVTDISATLLRTPGALGIHEASGFKKLLAKIEIEINFGDVIGQNKNLIIDLIIKDGEFCPLNEALFYKDFGKRVGAQILKDIKRWNKPSDFNNLKFSNDYISAQV